VVGLTGKQRPRFQLGDDAFRASQFAIKVLQQLVALLGVRLFARQRDVRFDVAGDRLEFCFRADLVFRAFAVSQDGLRRFLMVPEIRLRDACFQRFQFFAMLRSVKENSEPSRCAA
jgi:hypothetical protein